MNQALRINILFLFRLLPMLLLLMTSNNKGFSQCKTENLLVCIDGRSRLHIKDTLMWWEHISFVAPGQHSGCNTGISVNGKNWGTWNTPYTLPYNISGYSVSFKKVQCYYECTIIQTPDIGNGWESIYEFNDNPPGGPHTYELDITFCCAPVINFDDTVKVCKGEIITLGPTVVNNTVSYQWTPDSGLSCNNCSNPRVTEWKNRTYYIEGNGGLCKIKDTLVLIVYSSDVDAEKDTSLCYGESISLSAGTQNFMSLKWAPATGLNCDTCKTVIASPSVTTKYYVTVNDKISCKGKDSVTVKVNPVPKIEAGRDTSVCSGDSVKLTASGGEFYLWTESFRLDNKLPNLPVISSDSILFVDSAGVFIVHGIDKNCRNWDTVLVKVKSLPVVNAGSDTIICKNTHAFLSASGGIQYLWFPSVTLSDSTLSNPIASPFSSTQYIVKVTDTNKCSAFDTVDVNVAAPSASFISSTYNGEMPLTVHFTNTSEGTVFYHWSFDDNEKTISSEDINPSYTYIKTGKYNVTMIAQDTIGCQDTAVRSIKVRDQEPTLWIPNAFTPNRDGKNDIFTVQSINIIKFHGTIFNRWGELLFEWNDVDGGWDGTFKGRQCPDGVYVYIIRAKGVRTTVFDKTGFITLIR